MATTFRIEHEFPEVSLDLFEKYLNDPKLCEMLAEMPAFKERKCLEEKTLKSGERRWKFKVSAGGDLPSAIQKVVPAEMMSWYETSRFVPKDHCIYWKLEPLNGPGKFASEGVWQLESAGKGTRRVIEGQIDIKIPFVGKMVESFLVTELKKNYEKEPDIQRRFFREMK